MPVGELFGRRQSTQILIAGQGELQEVGWQERAFGVDGGEGVTGAGWQKEIDQNSFDKNSIHAILKMPVDKIRLHAV